MGREQILFTCGINLLEYLFKGTPTFYFIQVFEEPSEKTELRVVYPPANKLVFVFCSGALLFKSALLATLNSQ